MVMTVQELQRIATVLDHLQAGAGAFLATILQVLQRIATVQVYIQLIMQVASLAISVQVLQTIAIALDQSIALGVVASLHQVLQEKQLIVIVLV